MSGRFVLCGFAPAVRAVASPRQQNVVANRTPPNQAAGPFRASQQNQQHNDDRDRRARQILSPDVFCPVDHAFGCEPVGHKQNVTSQKDRSDQSQHNDFPNR